MSRYDTRALDLLKPNGEVINAELRIWEESEEDPDMVQLLLRFGSEELTSINTDFFSALCTIRAELERSGTLVRCYGASQDVYPSPMMQSMGDGGLAYRLRMGYPASQNDIVSIFDSGDDIILSSVDEQKDYYKRWLMSLEKLNKDT